jgi:hypothetical protein
LRAHAGLYRKAFTINGIALNTASSPEGKMADLDRERKRVLLVEDDEEAWEIVAFNLSEDKLTCALSSQARTPSAAIQRAGAIMGLFSTIFC